MASADRNDIKGIRNRLSGLASTLVELRGHL
jgi:hypothetical protein